MVRKIFITFMGIAAVGSTFIATGASAAPRHRHFTMPEHSALTLSIYEGSSTGNNCKIVGSITHHCLSFHSDSIWPQGLVDYHGSN